MLGFANEFSFLIKAKYLFYALFNSRLILCRYSKIEPLNVLPLFFSPNFGPFLYDVMRTEISVILHKKVGSNGKVAFIDHLQFHSHSNHLQHLFL